MEYKMRVLCQRFLGPQPQIRRCNKVVPRPGRNTPILGLGCLLKQLPLRLRQANAEMTFLT